MVRPFIWYDDLDPLTLELDLLFKNFNLGHYFLLIGVRGFIFHMCIPYGEAFFLYHDLDPPTFELGV